MTNKQYDLDEVRAKCGYLNETYAVCAAYGTEGQKTEAAIEFADYLAEVLPVIFGAYDRVTDFEKSQCAKLLVKVNQLEAERDAAVADMKAMADGEREKYGDELVCSWCSANFSDECAGFDMDKCFGWCGMRRGERE